MRGDDTSLQTPRQYRRTKSRGGVYNIQCVLWGNKASEVSPVDNSRRGRHLVLGYWCLPWSPGQTGRLIPVLFELFLSTNHNNLQTVPQNPLPLHTPLICTLVFLRPGFQGAFLFSACFSCLLLLNVADISQ